MFEYGGNNQFNGRFDFFELNYGILQSDMYQMYAYQKKYGIDAKSVTLLYPLTEACPNEEIKFVSEDGVIVHIVFVDLKHIEDLSKNLIPFLET